MRMSLVPLIADRLRQLRVRHCLTQEETAELVGISMRFYQLLESGRKKQVWLETVERLAVPFGLEAWQLLCPELPADTRLQSAVAESTIHYKRRRGPYRKGIALPETAPGAVSPAHKPVQNPSERYRQERRPRAG